jgi:2-polyprenyl-6-methoxyphenol hydroxylase-like FAD-dependent oxidoreductase
MRPPQCTCLTTRERTAPDDVLEMIVREGTRKMLQSALEKEADEFIGRGRYERTTEKRGYRNGHLPKRAPLVVGADGRFSKMRQLAGIDPETHGAAIDMLWCRLPRQAEDTPAQAGIYAGSRGGAYRVAVYRGEQWQIGLAFPKGI